MSTPVISQALPVPTQTTGVADLVGFGSGGVYIIRNSLVIQVVKVVNNFGYDAGGWRVDRHVRLLADTMGDKRSDVVGFGENGVWISTNNGNNTFTDPPKVVLGDFSYSAGGWRVEKHIRFMADLRKTGRADIIGFGDGGILVSRNNGSGQFAPAQLALNNFGYDQGWRLDRHLRFLADVTGDGLLDIVGFGESNVYIARNNGNATFQPPQAVVNNFCVGAGGWRIDAHPRIVADLTGDGRADVLGFGEAGVYTSLNNGSGAFGAVNLVLKDFGVASGWRVDKHVRCVASLTNQKRGDIVGFGDAGVYVALNNGNGTFGPVKRVIDNFGYDQGWRVDKHPRFVVDLTGDGCADIVGFGDSSVWAAINKGDGTFGPVVKLIDDLTYNKGWSLDKTVRYAANLISL